MKRAEITIKTTQRAAGQTDESTLIATGRYKYEGDALEVYYITEEKGQKLQTHLAFFTHHAVMDSKGAMERTMNFLPGETTETSLSLPMGRIDFLVKTKGYQAKFFDSGMIAQVQIVYDLWNNGALVAMNDLDILVMEVD